MNALSCQELAAKKCRACEGAVEKYSPTEAHVQLDRLSGWQLSPDGQRIRKNWQGKNFRLAMEFLNRVAELAEQEDHHPDLHLENYRHVRIELWTHAAGGLTENDFILAAKIDQLPASWVKE
jgi:4a-hydroxytetrahydrobiopterin dehydratase